MEDKKVEKWMLEDGRRAERWVTENEGERVVEIHMEEERPLILQQRIVEKSKPMIYERETSMLDKSGNIVDKKVETLDSAKLTEDVKQELIQSIVSALQGGNELKTMGLADEIAANQETEVENMNSTDKLLVGFIGLLILGLAYIVFFM